jgi:hypothetical protein
VRILGNIYVQGPFTQMLRVIRVGSWKLGVGSCLVALTCAPTARAQRATALVTWADIAPVRALLAAQGISAASFNAYVEKTRNRNGKRVSEGDLDHLVFYMLQSRRFTPLPPIEPALSAKALFGALNDEQRATFLKESTAPSLLVPANVQARAAALIRALESPRADERLLYFRELVEIASHLRQERLSALIREYIRAMRFVYEKEFVAQKSASPAAQVAALYRSRGLSTDTAVEAGYLVYLGLGVVRSLDPSRRIRRVLIVGPGLDLAPRTALHEEGPPQSYQPWAVIDALVSLGLARLDDLTVVGADINPRVVSHLRRAAAHPPLLRLTSEIRETPGVALTADYRDYFKQLGQAIGTERNTAGTDRLSKIVQVSSSASRALEAETVDIVTERLTGEPFDLVIATNILPYFDDGQLMLAMTNVAAMLRPGGILLHNEPRPFLGDITQILGLEFDQSRRATIATVQAAAPLADSVWIHRKSR